MKLRVILSHLCILVGYTIFGTYALSLRFKFGFPTEFYWLSFVFVSIPLLCEVAIWKNGARLRLFYLLMFSLIVHLQYVVVDSSPFLSSSDAVGDYRLADKIITDTRWMPFVQVEWGFGAEYRFYPITDFIYSSTSLLTGIPLLMVVKYLFVVKALVVPPLADRWFRSFFHHRVAYLATVLLLASPGAILFPHKESFAVIFFFIGMYAITKTEKTRQYLLICLVSMLTLMMTHHFTTYIFLLLLTSLFLASRFHKREGLVSVSGQFLMLSFIVFISWVTFIAWTVIAMHQEFLFDVFFEFMLPGEVTIVELMPQYAFYERIAIWLGLGVTIASTGLGFIRYVRTDFSTSFFVMTLFLIPILTVATVLRFSPSTFAILISHRAYEFGYICTGAFSAFFFVRAFQTGKRGCLNVLLVCAIIAAIMVGPLAGAMHPRTFAKASNVVSPSGLALDSWTSGSAANDDYVIGDRLMKLILEGYGNTSVFSYPAFFTSQNYTLPQDLRLESSFYVVTYRFMVDFYGPNAKKFDASPYFNNIYNSGMFNVYLTSDHMMLVRRLIERA